MGINTLTPRYLNLDNDSRIIAAQEMIDALNVRVSADDGGNTGVVKNIKGNTNLTGTGLIPNNILGTNKIVGCYEHEASNRFFVFVRNSFGVNSIHEMAQGGSTFTIIIESSFIYLDESNPIAIDGVVINENLYLYFTDGVNEPQKVNVDTVKAVGTYPASNTESAVLKVAPHAPTYAYSTDSAKEHNELYGKSFQFAYQYVYNDGEVSAIGEYTENTVGSNTLYDISDTESFKNRDNKITLQFGTGMLGVSTVVSDIRIFFRSPENNTMFYVGEFTFAEVFSGVDFYNDKSYSVVSDAEFNKTQDNVPKLAQAQTIAANRLFYGNYTEGFDKGTASATLSNVYQPLTVFEQLPAEIDNPASTTTLTIAIDTTDVESKLNGTDSITTLVNIDANVSVKSTETRVVSVKEADGTTTWKVMQSSDSEAGTAGKETLLYIDDFNFNELHSIAATTSFSTYNTNLAAAINGGTVSPRINYGKAYWRTTLHDTLLNFDNGTVTFDVTAAATTDGILITLTAASFNISGGKVDETNRITFNHKYYDYKYTLSDTFTATAADNYVSYIKFRGNTSSYSIGDSPNRTFKNGDNHSFGVVFEDILGRTTGVYEIGSINVPQLSTRAADERGVASVEATLSASGLDADLVNYFYVYSGGNSIGDYLQYSISDAFIIDSTKSEDSAEDAIYLGLRTLQGKSDSYGASKDLSYSYTKGDKLRVISYEDADGVRIYPSDLVFEINESKEVTEDIFDVTTYHEQRGLGQFIVVKDIDAIGFARSEVAAGGAFNFWENNTIVEFFSPVKEQTTKIYRALSGKYSVATDLGNAQLLTEGNAWYKQRNIIMPVGLVGVGTSWNTAPSIHFVESMQYSESDASTKGDLGGKPYAVIDGEKEHNRFSSLTYSEPQAADAAQLFLSSFNASLANFQDYELSYGGIFGLVNMSDSITLLQSDKISRVPVGRNILSTGSGSGFVTQTSEVLGLQQHYPIEAGINEDRNAFLKSNGSVYAVDAVRGKIVSLGAGGMSVLSDNGVSSWVEGRSDDMLAASSYSIKIGEDRRNGEIVFSLTDSNSAYEKSIVYSVGLGKFTSFVEYTSDFYGNLGNRFLQIKDNLVYEADTNALHSNFFGVQGEAYVKGVFAQSPTSRKVFNSIGVDATQSPSAVLSTIDQEVAMPAGAFALKEGVYYSSVPREEGTSQFISLGEVASEADPSITFVNKVNRLPFRMGGDVYKLVGGTLTDLTSVNVSSVTSARVLEMTNAGSVTAGDVLAVKGEAVDGDPLRGAYAEVKVVFDTTSALELFALSASTSESGLHNNSQQ